MTDPNGLAALADLRVVELGVWVAAPSAAALLADWGAEVIKVEPPITGDSARYLGPSRGGMSALFATLNRNKKWPERCRGPLISASLTQVILMSLNPPK